MSEKLPDNADLLARALYGRDAKARELLGGSECQIFADAAKRLQELRALEVELESALEFIGVMRDEMVLAGFRPGGREVLLESVRALACFKDDALRLHKEKCDAIDLNHFYEAKLSEIGRERDKLKSECDTQAVVIEELKSQLAAAETARTEIAKAYVSLRLKYGIEDIR